MPKRFRKVAVGGTFDRFHQGHEHLLTTAIEAAEHVVIGVTQPHLLTQKILHQIITGYEDRVKEVTRFLQRVGRADQAEIVPLSDPCGPTVTDQSLDGIVVSPQTMRGAQIINTRRQQAGLPPLTIEVCSLITDDLGHYLSSSRIREGWVNRRGHVYATAFKHTLTLTDAQKRRLQSPQGEVIDPATLTPERLAQAPAIALIGDQVTEEFTRRQLPVTYAVIDHRLRRRPHQTDLHGWQPALRFAFKNEPGTINAETVQGIYALSRHRNVLMEIDGEEDLLGLPFALSLPLESLIFYGQPRSGLVMIKLTEAKKDEFAEILRPDR